MEDKNKIPFYFVVLFIKLRNKIAALLLVPG